jgi:hypothetical protein
MTNQRRVTITVDITNEPGNDTVAIGILADIAGQLEHNAIYPTLIRLELGPTPPST